MNLITSHACPNPFLQSQSLLISHLSNLGQLIKHQPTPNPVLTDLLPTLQDMHHHKTLTIFFSLFSFPFLSIATPQSCPNATCYGNKLISRFPFSLENIQPRSCGYPGFTLSCNSANEAVVNFPNSGQFIVQSIDYSTQEIWVNDPNMCLPARILSLNLTASPFQAISRRDFMIYNCSSDHKDLKLNPIACLSGLNYTIFAISADKIVPRLALSCSFVRNVSVPVQWSFDERVVSSDLEQDLRLCWVLPACRRCESMGVQCGFKINSSLEVGCSEDPKHGTTGSLRHAISLAIGMLMLIFTVGVICFTCIRIHSVNSHHAQDPVTLPAVTLEVPEVSGLDGPTIQSFPKVVLGQSLRLPKPDFNICPICLSEYMPKETLRSIPQCQHCFHADCIDEWLSLNPTCPVCREQSFTEI